jgi:hypothetical protein
MSRWKHIRYRVGQFVHGWRARMSAEDRQIVARTLSLPAQELFGRMPIDAQAHSVAVLRSLCATGEVVDDLAVAALLHDVGKVAALDAGAYLGLWLRGPIVLLEALWPALVRRWADPEPAPALRYALYVHLDHPAIGAGWAEAAGCSPLTCWLIRHHQDKIDQAGQPCATLLARLQWADGRN